MTGEPGTGGFFHSAVHDGCVNQVTVAQQVRNTFAIILLPEIWATKQL